jgi:hypothetical protein
VQPGTERVMKVGCLPEATAGERPLFRTSNMTENCLTSISLAVLALALSRQSIALRSQQPVVAR